jgi:hypothetical protein
MNTGAALVIAMFTAFAYLGLPLRQGMQAPMRLEPELAGSSMFGNSHAEFRSNSPIWREVERNVYSAIT